MESAAFAALSDTAPPFAFNVDVRITASVTLFVTMFNANAPAMPTSAPLAPDTAFAPNFPLSVEPTIPALSVAPFTFNAAETPTLDEAVDEARFKPTATPTPYFAGFPFPAAEPSAAASASVVAADESVNKPPAVRLKLSGIDDTDELLDTFTPTAPARLTVVPELSFAAGADFPPVVPFEPVAAACELPNAI